MSLRWNWPVFPSWCTHSLTNVCNRLTCSLTVICISLTSIAFFIILASNSAGVSISPMMSLSKFFDSSDLRSFIRSWGQNNHNWPVEFAQQRMKTLFSLIICNPTLPRRDLKVCLISCLWALLLCATMSMIASSSVPVNVTDRNICKTHLVELKLCKGTSAFGVVYRNPSWLSSELVHLQRRQSWLQGRQLASAEEERNV